MNFVRFSRVLALVAGLLDSGTGLGLVFFPRLVLPLMRVPIPDGAALVYLRFVGAFVAAVGASYLWALLRRDLPRLRTVFEFTCLFRISAGGFSASAIMLGWLSPAWLSVPVTDFVLAGLQLWLLTKIPDDHASPSASPAH